MVSCFMKIALGSNLPHGPEHAMLNGFSGLRGFQGAAGDGSVENATLRLKNTGVPYILAIVLSAATECGHRPGLSVPSSMQPVREKNI